MRLDDRKPKDEHDWTSAIWRTNTIGRAQSKGRTRLDVDARAPPEVVSEIEEFSRKQGNFIYFINLNMSILVKIEFQTFDIPDEKGGRENDKSVQTYYG